MYPELRTNRFNVAQAAVTASGQSAAWVNDAIQGDVCVNLNFTAVTGTTPSLTAQLQVSDDGGTTWYSVGGAVTSAITATGQARIAASSVLEGMSRLNYTVTGTTPSFTFAIHVLTN